MARTARLRSASRSRERGFLTLIALLLVVVIIAVVFALYFGGSQAGPAATTPGAARERAEGVLCRNNLGQLRAAISMHQSTAGELPHSLESLGAGVALTCPVGGEPYEYDPVTGRVRCPHPGHGRY